MIELLILFELSKKVLTMYGISKEIRADFSVLTQPSYGTIKPALNRLEKSGFLKTQKSITSGGRPSTYYSITKDGFEELKKLIITPPLENPVQFLTSARVKLACAEILNYSEQKELIENLKYKSELILLDTKKLVKEAQLDFYPKMVFDNLTCEYNNFISLLEGFERACNSK